MDELILRTSVSFSMHQSYEKSLRDLIKQNTSEHVEKTKL